MYRFGKLHGLGLNLPILFHRMSYYVPTAYCSKFVPYNRKMVIWTRNYITNIGKLNHIERFGMGILFLFPLLEQETCT